MPYSHVKAVVRIALSAARNPVVTSWLVLTRKALPLVPAIASVSRFAWALTCSAGVKTPMTNVAIEGIPRAAAVARAAIDGIVVGAHSVGNPSVARTTMTRWLGLAVASALACASAPERAGAVGVNPSTMCADNEATMPGAAAGRGATSTAAVAYAPWSQMSRAKQTPTALQGS